MAQKLYACGPPVSKVFQGYMWGEVYLKIKGVSKLRTKGFHPAQLEQAFEFASRGGPPAIIDIKPTSAACAGGAGAYAQLQPKRVTPQNPRPGMTYVLEQVTLPQQSP